MSFPSFFFFNNSIFYNEKVVKLSKTYISLKKHNSVHFYVWQNQKRIKPLFTQ